VTLRGEFRVAGVVLAALCPLARAAIVRFHPLSQRWLLLRPAVGYVPCSADDRGESKEGIVASRALASAVLGRVSAAGGGIRVPGCGFAVIAWYGAAARVGSCSFCFGAAGGITGMCLLGLYRLAQYTSQSRCGG